MWVRGLKPLSVLPADVLTTSHPMWVRGLKPSADFDALGYEVAPHVGAWIETYHNLD